MRVLSAAGTVTPDYAGSHRTTQLEVGAQTRELRDQRAGPDHASTASSAAGIPANAVTNGSG